MRFAATSVHGRREHVGSILLACALYSLDAYYSPEQQNQLVYVPGSIHEVNNKTFQVWFTREVQRLWRKRNNLKGGYHAHLITCSVNALALWACIPLPSFVPSTIQALTVAPPQVLYSATHTLLGKERTGKNVTTRDAYKAVCPTQDAVSLNVHLIPLTHMRLRKALGADSSWRLEPVPRRVDFSWRLMSVPRRGAPPVCLHDDLGSWEPAYEEASVEASETA